MNILKLSSRIDAAIRFFLYVLVFWLPYSPAVIEVCVVAGGLLWGIKRSFEFFCCPKTQRNLKLFQLPSSFLNRPIYVFLIICLFSVFTSAFAEQSIRGFFTKTLEWFIIFFLILETFKEKKHIYTALGIFIFTSFSTVLDGWIQYYLTHKDIFSGNVILPGGRVNASFRTPNGLGGYLTIVLGTLLGLMVIQKKKIGTIGYALAIFLTIWIQILTYSRGSWLGSSLGVVFFIAIFLALFRKHDKKTGFICVAITCLIVLVFSFMTFNSANQSGWGRPTAQWRLKIWKESLQMIKDRPLLGHGVNTYMQVFQFYREEPQYNPTYAHNSFLQLTAEIGLLGIISYLCIIGKLFYEGLKGIKKEVVSQPGFSLILLGILSGVLAYYIQSFFDTNFYSLQLSVYVWYMIGILTAGVKLLVNERVEAHF